MNQKEKQLRKKAEKGLSILYRGKRYNTEKDKDELAAIFDSGLSAKQDLVTSLAMALLIEDSKLDEKNKKNKNI